MLLILEQIKEIDPESTWLEIAPTDIEQAQPDFQLYANDTGLHHARLNRLCLNKFQTWLTAGEVANRSSFSETELPAMWDLVLGVAIDIGKTRVILVPTELLDRSELRIPQEWVDLPNWLGDYYLGVQIDLESNLMSIWGFTSHRFLKERGQYNALDRTYSLDSDFLVNNLDLLSLAEELELSERTTVDELPSLSLDTALDLIRELSVPSPYSPRFNIDFPSWGAILNNPNLRSQLYYTRLKETAQIRANIQSIDRASVPSFKLMDWVRQEFTNTIASGWNSYRSDAVLSPSDNQTIERSKLINLQVNLQQETVILLIGLVPQSAEQIRVVVRVHPAIGSRYLPAQLQLNYLDENGICLQTAVARTNDNYIQLPRFTCPVGEEFNIQIKLDNANAVERFIV
ncbi:DUF1822 family protein [Chamaesiphon polymorphus]|uniref:DUF1822 domain-containing protein n=1 Tax=Chamaesiphon polymorphus CCALA 037 TaxID=2107692 RepID=A0A2T1GCE8_9CYAN|nr:DUF1822 family protein [Chamaesiphon polymorphus]PSB55075.1 hypothetical protein C7B77_16155 [Chamaesiphon polymorphus CCALA 037]